MGGAGVCLQNTHARVVAVKVGNGFPMLSHLILGSSRRDMQTLTFHHKNNRCKASNNTIKVL